MRHAQASGCASVQLGGKIARVNHQNRRASSAVPSTSLTPSKSTSWRNKERKPIVSRSALPDAAARFASSALDKVDDALLSAAAAGAPSESTTGSGGGAVAHFGTAAASATAQRLRDAASDLLPSSPRSFPSSTALSDAVSGASAAAKRAAEGLHLPSASSPSVFASRGESIPSFPSFSFSFDPHFGSDALDAAFAAPGAALSAASRALASAADAVASAVGSGRVNVDLSLPRLPELAAALSGASSSLSSLASAAEAALATGAVGGGGSYPLPLVLAAALGSIAAAAATAARPGAQAAEANGATFGPGDAPTFYSYEAASSYWSSRPIAVAKRASALAAAAARVGSGILLDRVTGRTEENEPVRAATLREELEKAGPAFIKIAQAVSTRVDLLSPAYVREIERLQDRVPPFASDVAFQEMAKAWGVRDVTEVVASISREPVAAASLGQVYKATLSPSLPARFYPNASATSSKEKRSLGGKQVAIKVQRPGVGEGILLDLLLLRTAGAALDSYGVLLAKRRGKRDGADDGNEEAKLVAEARTRARRDSGWAAIIDEWGARFMEELDYEREALNASYVSRQLESLEGVVVPKPVPSLSNKSVLVADWIDGERLSESTADDVLTLCTTLLNAYLVQLLEIGEVSGRLHGDAHEGNLLRTTDGRVAILDWGLVQEIPPHTSLALVEYIAHLSVSDWYGVCEDLGNLGFIPDGAPGLIEAGLAPALGAVLGQLSSGGGAKGVDVASIQKEIEVLSKRLVIQIPTYFSLILRTFSLIEGIALKADPNYSIVSKVFPYLARRLLTDDHPRARAALRQMLFGSEGRTRLDVKRLRRLTSGFSSYRTDGLVAASASSSSNSSLTSPSAPSAVAGRRTNQEAEEEEVIPKEALELLSIVFDPKGSYVQDILIEEASACADALSRDAARRAVGALAGIGGGGIVGAGVGRGGGIALIAEEPGDDEALENVRELVSFLADAASAAAAASGVVSSPSTSSRSAPPPRGLAGAASSARTLARALRDLRPVAPSLARGIARTAEGIARALAGRVLSRLGAARSNGSGSFSTSYEEDAAFRASALGRPRARSAGVNGSAGGSPRPPVVVAAASSSSSPSSSTASSRAASAAVAPQTGLFPSAAAAVALPALLLLVPLVMESMR